MVTEVVKFVDAPETFPAETSPVSMIGNEMIRIVTATTTTMIKLALMFKSSTFD